MGNGNGALAVREEGALATFTPSSEQVDLIRRTIAKGASDDELMLFVQVAQRHGLDPFKKEIFFVKAGGTVTHITSRDGYLSIAQRHPDFRGMQSGVVKDGDDFSYDLSPNAASPVVHRFGERRGQIRGAWCVVHREGRMPQLEWAEFAEYKRDTGVWKQYPSAMIEKVAQARALKFAFGISGLVTQEELGYQPRTVEVPRVEVVPPAGLAAAAAPGGEPGPFDDAEPAPIEAGSEEERLVFAKDVLDSAAEDGGKALNAEYKALKDQEWSKGGRERLYGLYQAARDAAGGGS